MLAISKRRQAKTERDKKMYKIETRIRFNSDMNAQGAEWNNGQKVDVDALRALAIRSNRGIVARFFAWLAA